MKHLPTIAFVYDKLTTTHGGAERVLSALHVAFPEAPLYTSICTTPQPSWAHDWEIHTTFLQKIPSAARLHKVLTPLKPLAFETLDLSPYDIVISITSAEAKGVLTHPNQLHICYLLTPTRYLFSHQDEYLQSETLLKLPGLGFLTTPLRRYAQWWDQAAAHRPDYLIPISQLVALRSKKYYGRDTLMPIYPPVCNLPTATKLKFSCPVALSVSRLVAYKRIDLAINACKEKQIPLVVVGTGPEEKKLRYLAGPELVERTSRETLQAFCHRAEHAQAKIWWVGTCAEDELATLYSSASIFLLPGIEDFGIAPLEAAWYGTPSIVHGSSGVAELLPAPTHSLHLQSLTLTAVQAALDRALTRTWHSELIKKRAQEHTVENFTSQFTKVVYDLFIQFKSREHKT